VESKACQVPASEINDLREESLQEEPLPEDVRLQAMQPEAVFCSVGFKDA
jgi:hypothetical protein